MEVLNPKHTRSQGEALMPCVLKRFGQNSDVTFDSGGGRVRPCRRFLASGIAQIFCQCTTGVSPFPFSEPPKAALSMEPTSELINFRKEHPVNPQGTLNSHTLPVPLGAHPEPKNQGEAFDSAGNLPDAHLNMGHRKSILYIVSPFGLERKNTKRQHMEPERV